MSEFLKFFNEKTKKYPMHLEIFYGHITDWIIRVYKQGCAEDGSDIPILNVQECDMELAFAKAQVELKEWLLDNVGGY